MGMTVPGVPLGCCVWEASECPNRQGRDLSGFRFLRDSGVIANTTVTVPRLGWYGSIATDLGMKLGQGLSKIRCGGVPQTIFLTS